MKNMVILLAASLLAISCSCQPRYTVHDIEPVDVDPIKEDVMKATGFAFTAQREVTDAQAQIVKAKVHLKETEALIEHMKKNKSRYTEQIKNLKGAFSTHIEVIEKHLIKTGEVLKSQIESLRQAEKDLSVAKEKIITLEGQRNTLISENSELTKDLKKAEDYKDKYHKLTKYRWIVWGLGIWIIVKFLGGLGAWSPQGRIARMLIG